MSKVFGIDLGTTYSAIATLDSNGMPEVIENFADSEPTLASAVYFPENGVPPVIGKEAKNQAEVAPDRVVQFIKREIGKEDAIIRNFDGTDYDPIVISSLILKRMKEYTEEQGQEVKDVVITCPAYFGINEKNATRQAGIIAGLNVLDIIHEPTAAALSYCCREFPENRKILVYDLGGGTFDVTIVDFSVTEDESASVKILASAGDDRLGGIDWDKRLYEYICQLYADENGISPDEMDAELCQRISVQVESVKRGLTGMQTKSFTITDMGDTTRIEVSREKFGETTKDLMERTLDFVNEVLKKADLSAEDIETVLLVGGSTLMPMVKEAVEQIFPGNGRVRREDPHLAVAKGAAIAASLHFVEPDPDQDMGEKPVPNPGNAENGGGKIGLPPIKVTQEDIISRSFGPAIFNENGEYVIDNLLFCGDPSPAVVSKSYGTMCDNQSGVEIPIFENFADDRENTYVIPDIDEKGNKQYTDPLLKVKYLGDVSFKLPQGTPAGSPIRVEFNFSSSGLKVVATNESTGENFPVDILSTTTKTQEELKEDIRRLSAIHTSGQI